MTDEEFALLIEGFLDGTLGPEERRALARVALGDPARRAQLEFHVRLHVALGTRLAPPGEGAARRQVELVRAASSETRRIKVLKGVQEALGIGTARARLRSTRRFARPPAASWALWAAAAAACFILFASLYLSKPRAEAPKVLIARPEEPAAPVEPPAPAAGAPLQEAPRSRPSPEPRVEPPAPAIGAPPRAVPAAPPGEPAPTRTEPPPPVPQPPPAVPEPPMQPPRPAEEQPLPEAPKVTVAIAARLERVEGAAILLPAMAPAAAGRDLAPGEGIETVGKAAVAVLRFADRTRVELGGQTALTGIAEAAAGKRIALVRGSLAIEAVPPPAGRPLVVATPHAEATVLGTKFIVSCSGDSTRLEVNQGRVRLTRLSDRRSVTVAAGHYAVAAAGVGLAARPIPAWTPVGVDFSSGAAVGDGAWSASDRAIVQTKVSRARGTAAPGPSSDIVFRASAAWSVLIEVLAEVKQVTPDRAPGAGAWGFGLVADFGEKRLVLRSIQNATKGSVFEVENVKDMPFEHGREGAFRLKFLVDRRAGRTALLRGKIWQGDLEPDGWTLETDAEIEGPLTAVGLQTTRCACVFTQFKAQGRKEER